MRYPLVLMMLLACAGCRGGSSAPESSSASSANDALLTKDEVLEILARHGLDPQTAPAPEVSKKMATALAGMANGPTDRFLLGIDNEGLMAFEFSSIEDAKLMEARHDGDGFRHRNWYFGGLVSAEVYNKTKEALKKGNATSAGGTQ